MISSFSSGQSVLGTGRPMLTRYSEEELRGSQAVPCTVPVLDLTAVPWFGRGAPGILLIPWMVSHLA